jgi:hypothetical protein
MNIKRRPYLGLMVLLLMLWGCYRPLYNAKQMEGICNGAAPVGCNWMNQLITSHPNQQIALVNICLPASHDAGTYIRLHCTVFANEGNTQTQYLPMKEQLEAGLRLFDIRPYFYEGEFYTHHSMRCDGYGCKCDKLVNMLGATRDFADNHAEVVFLQFTHYCHTSQTDTAFLNLLYHTLGDRIYKPDTGYHTPLYQTPLSHILQPGARTGKVVLLLEDEQDTPAAHALGLFNTAALHDVGGWTNDHIYTLLKQHQLANFKNYPGNGNALFSLAWQYTQSDAEALNNAFAPRAKTGIVYGAHYINTQLPGVLDSLVITGAIHKGRIPNIIWSDFADTMVVNQCLKLTAISVN